MCARSLYWRLIGVCAPCTGVRLRAVAAASASEAVVAAAHAAGIEAPTEAELRAAAEAAAASAVPYAMMLRPEMRARLRLGHTNALVEVSPTGWGGGAAFRFRLLF